MALIGADSYPLHRLSASAFPSASPEDAARKAKESCEKGLKKREEKHEGELRFGRREAEESDLGARGVVAQALLLRQPELARAQGGGADPVAQLTDLSSDEFKLVEAASEAVIDAGEAPRCR